MRQIPYQIMANKIPAVDMALITSSHCDPKCLTCTPTGGLLCNAVCNVIAGGLRVVIRLSLLL